MPSTSLKTASPGFLRNINFSGLTDARLRTLFGEVEQPPWMKFTIHPVRDACRGETVFNLTVDIDPQRKVTLSPDGLRVGRRHRRRRFRVSFPVPDAVMVEFGDRLSDMFGEWLERAIRSEAHKLYELDPRIGWRYEKDGDELPRSPLFDPPGEFSRTGLPVRDEEDPTVVEYSRCPFCREVHEKPEAPIWGGANLMWVHPYCWRGS